MRTAFVRPLSPMMTTGLRWWDFAFKSFRCLGVKCSNVRPLVSMGVVYFIFLLTSACGEREETN